MKKFLLFTLVVVLCFFTGALLFASEEKEELIVYHWWTAGGEKEAIDAVFKIYNEMYPNIEIVENPVAGGGGGVMRGQIKTMVMAGESPDTFQLTYGSGMLLLLPRCWNRLMKSGKGCLFLSLSRTWGR